MRIKAGVYSIVFVLILMLYVIGASLRYRYWEAKLLPLVIAGIIFALALIQLINWFRGKEETPATEEGKVLGEVTNEEEILRFGSALGWVVGFILTIYLLGFWAATALFVFSYMKVRGRGWSISIGFALIITVLTYGIFELGLKAKLYSGLLPSLLG